MPEITPNRMPVIPIIVIRRHFSSSAKRLRGWSAAKRVGAYMDLALPFEDRRFNLHRYRRTVGCRCEVTLVGIIVGIVALCWCWLIARVGSVEDLFLLAARSCRYG